MKFNFFSILFVLSLFVVSCSKDSDLENLKEIPSYTENETDLEARKRLKGGSQGNTPCDEICLASYNVTFFRSGNCVDNPIVTMSYDCDKTTRLIHCAMELFGPETRVGQIRLPKNHPIRICSSGEQKVSGLGNCVVSFSITAFDDDEECSEGGLIDQGKNYHATGSINNTNCTFVSVDHCLSCAEPPNEEGGGF